MPPEPTSHTRFALEGFLPLWLTILIGVGLLAFSWWLARRDARVSGRPRIVWSLFVLRCAAILVLLWILAGPTTVTTVTTLRTRTLAFLVDASASMGLVDLIDGSGNVSRWAAARKTQPGAKWTRVDEAVGTIRAAERQLIRFSRLPSSGENLAEARKLLEKAVSGLEKGLEVLEEAVANLPGAQGELKTALGLAGTAIRDRVLDVLPARAAEFNRGKTLTALERERWLPERLTVLSVAVGHVEQLAESHVTASEQPEANAPGELAAVESQWSRIDKVESLLARAEEDWLKNLRQKATVLRYEFGEKVVPLGTGSWSEPKGRSGSPRVLAPGTSLGAALQQVALDDAAQRVEAAILFTDGGHNTGRDPRELASSLAGAALHIVPIGNTRMQRDVILHHTHAPRAVLQNDNVVIDSIITAYDCEGEQLQVELLANGVVADRKTIEVGAEVFDSRVQLRWKAAQLGKHTLSFRVIPVSDERSEANNASEVDVLVMEDHIRVLVADNYPRWETRYLLNLFRRDDRVTFDQLLFEPQPVSGEGARSSFPNSVEEWSAYRVVILGDVLPNQLTPEHQRSLRQYVSEAGGNVIVIAGREAMPAAYINQPLAAILPVEAGTRALPGGTPFYLHVTDEGSMSLATQIADGPGMSERVWRETSQRLPIYGLSEFSRPKPTSHSLIFASPSKTTFSLSDSSTRSFLAWHYLGAGRVVYIAAPLTYQLRYRQGDAFHHRFWGQLLRWTVARDLGEGSRTVRLIPDKSRYEDGESAGVSVRLSQVDGRAVTGASVQVEAFSGDELVQALTLKEDATRPGAYHGTLEILPVGSVKLRASGDRVRSLLAAEKYNRPVETTIHIDPSGELELRHPLCNLPLLREIADASDGMIIPPTALKSVLEQLSLEPEAIESVSKMPLWSRWDLFWIFVVGLCLEWAGRKYLGLS